MSDVFKGHPRECRYRETALLSDCNCGHLAMRPMFAGRELPPVRPSATNSCCGSVPHHPDCLNAAPADEVRPYTREELADPMRVEAPIAVLLNRIERSDAATKEESMKALMEIVTRLLATARKAFKCDETAQGAYDLGFEEGHRLGLEAGLADSERLRAGLQLALASDTNEERGRVLLRTLRESDASRGVHSASERTMKGELPNE